jgi:methionyl-tRNA formyltransferase
MSRTPLRVAFAGTPPFARAALERIVAAGETVPLVLTQPDRPAGRGLKLQPSPVKAFAVERGLPLAQPRSLRLDGRWPDDARAARDALRAAQADVLVVAAYGLILPRWVLDLPRAGGINIHASLLPRWRGAAPVQRAIEAGDAETGITLMQMDEGLDTGDRLAMRSLPIAAGDSAASLTERLAALGAQMIVDGLRDLKHGPLPRSPQPSQGMCYAHKVDKAEAAVDWRAPAAVIERRVRAFDPAPGAHFALGGETVKLWRAALRDAPAAGTPGEILHAADGRLTVACGAGALDLLEMQRPGGRRQPAAQLLQALAEALATGRRLPLPEAADPARSSAG